MKTKSPLPTTGGKGKTAMRSALDETFVKKHKHSNNKRSKNRMVIHTLNQIYIPYVYQTAPETADGT